MAYNTYGDAGSTYGDAKGVYGQLAANLLNRTESGSGNQVSTLKAALPRTDSGTGADASVKIVKINASDSGHGTDSSSQHVSITATQTAVHVDYVVVEMLIQQESGTGTDFSDLTVAFDVSSSDSGTGDDSASVSTTGGGTPVHASDSAHGTEASSVKYQIFAFDSGTSTIVTSGGGSPEFGGVYFGEYPGAGAGGIISGEVATLKVALVRNELGLALDSSVLRPHPPSPEEVPGLIVLRGKLLFRMGEGVLAYA